MIHYQGNELLQCHEIYRTIHRNPEIGLKEEETCKYIRGILEKIQGIEIDNRLEGIQTAIIVRIQVQNPINCILLRTELDALNFQENSDLPFKATNGLHHACGHDAHMASLITAIKIAARNRDKLRRNLIFCFQPGEEGKGGASKLFKAKPDLLEGVDECYAIHFSNGAVPGTIILGKGPVTAISARLSIKFEGKSAHLMMPHAGIDANFIGCTLVTQLYSLIGMKIPPLEGATLVIYYINGGTMATKVSDKFELVGSVRVTTMQSFNALKQTIAKLTEGLCSAYGASKPQIILNTGHYRPVINDQKVTERTRKKLEHEIKDLIVEDNQKSFAGEDFCEFSQRRPSCYITVGSAPPGSIDPITKQSKFPLHSPKHKLDEQAFKTSLKIWEAIMFK